MPVWKLFRDEKTSDGVRGRLTCDSFFFCYTLERPDLNNQPELSCIPCGVYEVKRTISPHFGDVFQVINVPNRDHILIHKGNTEDDVKGCIVLGVTKGTLNGKIAVLGSKEAFDKFMRKMEGINEFTLTIQDDD